MENQNPLREVWGKWPGSESIDVILETLRGDNVDRRDDNAMATGCYPRKRSRWRRLWRPMLETAVALIIAFLTCLGVWVVVGWLW